MLKVLGIRKDLLNNSNEPLNTYIIGIDQYINSTRVPYRISDMDLLQPVFSPGVLLSLVANRAEKLRHCSQC